jgi:ABC-type branched-subunit amino acid transport system ATPase component
MLTHSRFELAPLASELAVVDVSVAFGGNVVLDTVTLTAPTGMITGLIGPNGAGKTTLFNACTGTLQPSRGAIRLGGTDVTALSPARRAQLGLGRTFQRMELFESLTVAQNVALGRESALAGSHPLRHIIGRRSDRRDISEATTAALERCAIAEHAHVPVASLSTGQRRLVELARALAAGRSMLLLDEPSSGLDHHETERFGAILRAVVDDGHAGILLIEHDMDLVMSVCDRLYALDFGTIIAEGTCSEVQTHPAVRRAYLGEED